MDCIASNHGLGAIAPVGKAIAINQDACRFDTQSLDGARHGEKGGLQDIDPVNLLDRGQPYTHCAMFKYLCFKHCATGRGQLFAVIQPRDAIGTQDYGSGNDRPRERPTPRLVHTCD